MTIDTVREDLGYFNGQVIPMNKSRFVVKKRIRYTQGVIKDRVVDVKESIADDLIARGMAVEVGAREPGEEG
jgi:hypothetical protein